MPVSFAERQACVEMADILYKFLPGSGSTQWTGHINFATVAERVGVGDFWEAGSKRPAIRTLLERTLSIRRGLFQKLILDVVSEGLLYTMGSADRINRDDIDRLNTALRKVHFQFPELIDPKFLSQLSSSSLTADRGDDDMARLGDTYSPSSSKALRDLDELRKQFYSLANDPDRQQAGRMLQSVLYDLLELHGMRPNPSYRVPGEELDGSFALDNQTYLLEAKWERTPADEADLLIFHGKTSGKSNFTRGLFLSINGVSIPALEAIRIGKRVSFIIADGSDLVAVLEGQIRMDELVRMKVRAFAERGRIFVPCTELLQR